MKRKLNFIVLTVMAILLSTAGLSGQDVSSKSADDKKKQEELQKQEELRKKEEMQKQLQVANEDLKLKQAEIEAKRKEIQAQMAEIETDRAKDRKDFEWSYKEFDDLSRHARDLSRDLPMVVIPDIPDLPDIQTFGFDAGNNIYLYRGHGVGSKPGSSWNYTRQVMEATFTNEFTMSAEDMDNVSLSVSGDCAEGSMSVAIIMPDGKQLSEVVLDENGSLNWRKSFEADEGNGWKNGKWTFRVKAKEATGNLRIAMNSY